jgi:hypothetical protein
MVGGQDSEEYWVKVERVSAKSLTSRKEREKWGTRHPWIMDKDKENSENASIRELKPENETRYWVLGTRY